MPRPKNPQPSGDAPTQRKLRPRPSAQAPNIAGSKRSRSSKDPPPRKQARPRSSAQPQSLPTPDDALSVADSAAPPTSHAEGKVPAEEVPAEEKVPAGPPNPGVVRTRHQGVLSRLPPDTDVLDAFAQLRRDNNLSDEQAFMRLITTYNVSMATLNQISCNVSPTLLHRKLICATNIIDDPQPQGYLHHLVTSNMRT